MRTIRALSLVLSTVILLTGLAPIGDVTAKPALSTGSWEVASIDSEEVRVSIGCVLVVDRTATIEFTEDQAATGIVGTASGDIRVVLNMCEEIWRFITRIRFTFEEVTVAGRTGGASLWWIAVGESDPGPPLTTSQEGLMVFLDGTGSLADLHGWGWAECTGPPTVCEYEATLRV